MLSGPGFWNAIHADPVLTETWVKAYKRVLASGFHMEGALYARGVILGSNENEIFTCMVPAGARQEPCSGGRSVIPE